MAFHACSIKAEIGAVTLYVRRAAAHGWGWPLPDELDNASARGAPVPSGGRDPGPSAAGICGRIHRELARTGVTLQLLWEEYAQVYPEGYRYSQFCVLYRQWARRLRPSMRQVHRAGEKTFIDFSGKRPTVVDRRTGEVRSVEQFVAVLGASSYTYAEATATQQLPDWVGAHTRMVEYFGGTTALWERGPAEECHYPIVSRTRPGSIVPMKNWRRTTRPWSCRPARASRKSKAVVESAVLVAQRWILARLRDQTFFSLAALNAAIWARLRDLNDRPLQQLGVSRRTRYAQLDRPALRPLPTCRYVLAEWKPCRVSIATTSKSTVTLQRACTELIHERGEVRFH